MTYLSLHNDQPFTPRYTPDNLDSLERYYCERSTSIEAEFEPLAFFMDDAVREQVHAELAPCTPRAFLARYLELATEPLIVG